MTPEGVARLKADEGQMIDPNDGMHHAYPDPLTGAAPWTIGYGCTGEGIGPHTVWTEAKAQNELMYRIGQIEDQLDTKIPWHLDMSEPRQDVFVNMAYNLGVSGFLGFHGMLGCAEAGDYDGAAAHMLDSKWATQVKGRASRLADIMKIGAYPA